MTLRRRSGDRAYVLAPLRGYQLAVEEGGRWRVVRVVQTEREAEGWLYAPAVAVADGGA